MRAYLPKLFLRQTKKSQVTESDCKAAVIKAEKGLIYANLGGGLIKQDIPRNNLSGARGARRSRDYLLQKGERRSIPAFVPEECKDQSDQGGVGSISETCRDPGKAYRSEAEGAGRNKRMERARDMTQTKRYRSDPLRSLHSVAEDLYGVGVIDKTTMRDFDLACLTAVEALGPEAIKKIREKAHMSQATFALALNVTTVLVSKWERGEVRPSGPSLKLLALTNSKGIEAIL